MTKQQQRRHLTTETVTPPDGGHGWLVAIGLGVFFVVTMGPLPSFGLIFSQFMDNLNIGARGVATVVSVFLATFNFSGVLCSLLAGSVSQRMLGCIAALIFFTGNLLSAFATSLLYLVLTYGILQGIGFGMMKSVAHATLNSYFRDKRTTANGMAQTINALGSLFFPGLIRYLVDGVGFRGTEMVLAAISLHAFAAMTLMTPPKPRSSPLKDVLIVPLTSGEEDTKSGLVHKFTLVTDIDENEGRKNTTFGYEPLLPQRSGPSSGVWENLVALSRKCLRWIFVSLNLSVLKSPRFFSMALGVCMTHVADTTFFALQPVLLLSMGYDKTFVTTVITASAAGDIAGRVILSALGHWLSSRNRLIFGLSSFLSALHIVVFLLLVEGDAAILGVTASMGFFRGCIYVTLPLVFAESFTVDEFPSVYNLYMVFCGFITMASGPVIGAVSNGDPSLCATFMVLAAMLSVSVIIWSFEALLRYLTERRSSSSNS